MVQYLTATATSKKANGTANGSGEASKGGVEVREAKEQPKRTKSSCMNGITFCFKVRYYLQIGLKKTLILTTLGREILYPTVF